MDDLIRRKDAIRAVAEVLSLNRFASFKNIKDFGRFAERMLRNVPSTDRPQGEWIETDMRCYGATVYKCSVCGDDVDEMPTVMGVPKYKFCPYCGAMMKGADDE